MLTTDPECWYTVRSSAIWPEGKPVVLFNCALKELTAKIVYYGPGLSGKTSNLQYIYEDLPIKNKGRMLTLATDTDRTLYFDFLPVDAGIVRGIKTRVQLYTVPGQVFYNATRRMVLKGADGVVFVADSQPSMPEANRESLDNLRENLAAHDLKLEALPMVMQFNKRDLEDVCTVEEMNDALNTMNAPFYEAVAKDGIGVEETLQAISGLVLKSVIDRYGGARAMSPMGKREKTVTNSALTDPASLVSTSVTESTGERAQVSQVASSQDASAKAASTWPSVSEKENVASHDDDHADLDAFENLNIESILDDALRLDDATTKDTKSRADAPSDSAPTAPEAPEDSMFSGLLDEGAGVEVTATVLKEPSVEEHVVRDLEADFLGGTFDAEQGRSAAENLSELIKTQISMPRDQATTIPPASVSGPIANQRIEVPVTIEVDDSLAEQEIELLLKIRLKRK